MPALFEVVGCAGLLDLLDCFVGLRPIPHSTRDRHCVASCALRAGALLAMTGKGVIARS